MDVYGVSLDDSIADFRSEGSGCSSRIDRRSPTRTGPARVGGVTCSTTAFASRARLLARSEHDGGRGDVHRRAAPPSLSRPRADHHRRALARSVAEAGDDSLWGTRGGEQMVELDHQISMSFEPGYATMVVRRTVHNQLDRHDEAVYEIAVPSGGVAVGLRTLGQRYGKQHWYRAELLEARLAEARYRELTGMDPHHPEPKDPALLAWSWDGELALQVWQV